MATQFTIYTASDPNGPGPLNGITGSLITVLDACLVNGYTGKAAAGWTKPVANSGSFYACYKQPSGSQCTLFVNDDGGVSAANGKEAAITGWETITSVFGTGVSGSNNVGSGFAQFPLPTQQNTVGRMYVRKSTSIDAVVRWWMIAADAYTCYMWVNTGDVALAYYHWMFGDILSINAVGDLQKCLIYGRVAANSGLSANTNNGTAFDYTDVISAAPAPTTTIQYITQSQPGHFINRNGFGLGTSLAVNKRGDSSLGTGTFVWTNPTPHNAPMHGVLQSPNGSDNLLYLSPIYINEPQPTNGVLRGRLRGLFHPCHPTGSLIDGQTFSGSSDYAGKMFTVVKQSAVSSMWLLETSNTVEVN